MATIKVTYGQTTQEFTIASDTTWMEFESRLHDLFKIPNETAISVSYVDEDDDVINLSTDSELQKVLSDQELFGANVRFSVYTSENPDGNDSNGWNLEDAEENDESVVALKDEETSSNDDEKIVAYRISEPDETENTQVESPLQHEGQDNVQQQQQPPPQQQPQQQQEPQQQQQQQQQPQREQQQQQQPAVKINYPHVTVTDEDDDDLSFETTIPKEKDSETQQESSCPVEGIGQKREVPIESSNDPEKQSTTPNENDKENDEGSENDSNVFFIFSTSPWIRRTYYRPRVSLFDSLLGENHTHFGHFGHFVRPRYSLVTPLYDFGGYRSRGCGRYYGRRIIGGRSYNNYWGYC